MPLIFVSVFFVLLFSGEFFWYLAGLSEQERLLRRYNCVEHPDHHASDAYLDRLG